MVPESSPNLFNLVTLGGLCLDDWWYDHCKAPTCSWSYKSHTPLKQLHMDLKNTQTTNIAPWTTVVKWWYPFGGLGCFSAWRCHAALGPCETCCRLHGTGRLWPSCILLWMHGLAVDILEARTVLIRLIIKLSSAIWVCTSLVNMFDKLPPRRDITNLNYKCIWVRCPNPKLPPGGWVVP